MWDSRASLAAFRLTAALSNGIPRSARSARVFFSFMIPSRARLLGSLPLPVSEPSRYSQSVLPGVGLFPGFRARAIAKCFVQYRTLLASKGVGQTAHFP